MKFTLLFIFISFSTPVYFAQTAEKHDSITAFFGYNQSEVLNETVFLDQLKLVDISTVTSVRVVGYTDPSGSFKRNKVLASDRIRSVRELLNKSGWDGIKTETINANEVSGTRLATDELNRRVDVVFYAKPKSAVPKESKLTFELNKPLNLNINFVGGKAEFLYTSYPNLEKLLELMKEDTTLLLKLHGHVCCADDMELSVKRAKAVLDYLKTNGISNARMSSAGFSNSMRLVADDSEEHMSMNRRVEAIFYRKD